MAGSMIMYRPSVQIFVLFVKDQHASLSVDPTIVLCTLNADEQEQHADI